MPVDAAGVPDRGVDDRFRRRWITMLAQKLRRLRGATARINQQISGQCCAACSSAVSTQQHEVPVRAEGEAAHFGFVHDANAWHRGDPATDDVVEKLTAAGEQHKIRPKADGPSQPVSATPDRSRCPTGRHRRWSARDQYSGTVAAACRAHEPEGHARADPAADPFGRPDRPAAGRARRASPDRRSRVAPGCREASHAVNRVGPWLWLGSRLMLHANVLTPC